VSGARAIISISHATADAIARVYPEHAHKVRVIHHGIDHEQYAPERAGPRALLDDVLPRAFRYSLIVGQGSPYKNHLGMVRAFLAANGPGAGAQACAGCAASRASIARMNELIASAPTVAHKVVVLPS